MKIHADKELIRKKVIAEVLKKADLFSGLSSAELGLISSICEIKKFKRNDVIFTVEQSYSGFFYISEGIVKIFDKSRNGEEKVIHIFHKGDTFAEVPVFEKPSEIFKGVIKFPANASCLKNASKIIYIPAKDFIEVIKANSSISFKLLSGLSKKLKIMQTRNFSLKFQDADRRLLSFLLTNFETKEDLFNYCNMGDTDEILLKISKSDLAAYIGTAQASLSRIFRKFSDINLMKIRGKKIHILNKKELLNYLHKI